MLNVSSCKFNAPAFISYPHFYKADPFYLNQFEPGMFNPNQDLHESQLSIEPVSGVPLDVKVRMQINALVNPLQRTLPGGGVLNVKYVLDVIMFLSFVTRTF